MVRRCLLLLCILMAVGPARGQGPEGYSRFGNRVTVSRASQWEAWTTQPGVRVIDVSGDGPNTLGRTMTEVRDMVVKSGTAINGLAIHRPSYPDLDVYYREAITGGPGSFVIKVESRASFAQAILKKLVREIAAAPASPSARPRKVIALAVTPRRASALPSRLSGGSISGRSFASNMAISYPLKPR